MVLRWSSRDPARELAFYQGGALDRLFEDAALIEPVDALRTALRGGADAFNCHPAITPVLRQLGDDLREWSLGDDREHPLFEVWGFLVRAVKAVATFGQAGAIGLARVVASRR